jgi:hypothetical protein
MSAADLLAVLVAGHLRVDWDQPASPANDHLIFSKGHASPLLYSVFKAVGGRLRPGAGGQFRPVLRRSRWGWTGASGRAECARSGAWPRLNRAVK